MKKPLEKICKICSKLVIIMINPKDLNKWRNGTPIQDALKYLSPAEREIILSDTCGECFDKMFPPEEE